MSAERRIRLPGRRAIASIATLAVLIGTPVTVAILHPGYPLDDVELVARDVWVTDESDALVGRLNVQIEQLSGAVRKVAPRDGSLGLLQDGDDVFVHDPDDDTLQRISSSYVELDEKVSLPDGARVAFGGGRLAIADAAGGRLWVVDVSTGLQFDPAVSEPILADLGPGLDVAVSPSGTVLAFAPEAGRFFRVPRDGIPVALAEVAARDVALTAVGDRGALLDYETGAVVFDDGRRVELAGTTPLRLQQAGPTSDAVVVATSTGLVRVPFSGDPVEYGAGLASPVQDDGRNTGVAAPVVVGSCAHGAWAPGARYLRVCSDGAADGQDIGGLDPGQAIEFRVNRAVIALNAIDSGQVWLASESLVGVEVNWLDVEPPLEQEEQAGDETIPQPMEQLLAERSDENTPPIAAADAFGVRPGRTTILRVLDNDVDSDGDVLTITEVAGDLPGTVAIIDDGRALQFDSTAGVSGASLRYVVSDGRAGGIAETTVDVQVRYDGNGLPERTRTVAPQLEVGQTVSYDVLQDWRDPDGDDLRLVAVDAAGESVRFSADGVVTYTHSGSEAGDRVFRLWITDGRDGITEQSPPTGEIVFDVAPAGTLKPVSISDFAATFASEVVEIAPLANDMSPSGAPLELGEVVALTEGATVTVDRDAGLVRATAAQAGTYYLEYQLLAGSQTNRGLVRLDVTPEPGARIPPVAVRDVAYLRVGQSVTLPVLANDVSPTGDVLAVQSYEVDPALPLEVELLGRSALRLTRTGPSEGPLEFRYTVSDGFETSTTGVSVVPVPDATHPVPPIATDDVLRVRAGDVASIDVLANDFDPDGAAIGLDGVLLEDRLPGGVAFVSGDRVRVQAPDEATNVVVRYQIRDADDQLASGSVQVIVVPEDAENAAPVPRTIEARVFQNMTVPIEIPLDGIDPDGDSVTFVGASGGVLGSLESVTPTSITYRANSDAQGTDILQYTVRDSLGEIGRGELRIAVVPVGPQYPPTAVDDDLTLRPGRTATISVLANDSDPTGYPISLGSTVDVQSELFTAELGDDGGSVVLVAGDAAGEGFATYTLLNENDGRATGYVRVTIDEDAPVLPPTAVDHAITSTQTAGGREYTLDVRAGASNPGGRLDDLVVGLTGPNADFGSVAEDGRVTVQVRDEAYAIAYTLTNEVDELTGTALIVVPRFTDDAPPALLQACIDEPLVVAQDQVSDVDITPCFDVPSGRPVVIVDDGVGSATQGRYAYGEGPVFEFTPLDGYRGRATVSFTVGDGDTTGPDTGNTAFVTMPIAVGSADLRDVSPAFTRADLQVQLGDPTTFDLTSATTHPERERYLGEFRYTIDAGDNPDVSAQLSGSTLTLSAAPGSTGETARFRVTVAFGDLPVSEGEVVATVVSSTRPLARANDDAKLDERPTSVVRGDVLANDVDPFADLGSEGGLRVVEYRFEGDPLGATAEIVDNDVVVRTGTAKSGTITVVYTIADYTDDDNRRVQGRLTIVVVSAPDPVTDIQLSNPASQQVDVVFQAPATNGAPIEAPDGGYTVTISGPGGTVSRTDCVAGAVCAFTGRTNGSVQTVTVEAANRAGATPSGASPTITPYGVPGTPSPVQFSSSNGGTAPPGGAVTMTWGLVDTGGGSGRYYWTLFRDGTAVLDGFTTDSGSVTRSGLSLGTYTFTVRACNAKGGTWTNCGALAGSSNSASVTVPPPQITLSRGASTGVVPGCSSGNCYYFHIEARYFSAGQTFSVECRSNDGSGEVSIGTTPISASGAALRFDGAGNYSGDIACWDGYGNVNRARIGSTYSNTSDF